MKKSLIFILIASFCFLLCACTNEKKPKTLMEKVLKNDKLVIGVREDAKPFGYLDENNKLQGFDIDLAHLIAKNILGSENKVEFIPVTPSNRIITLTSEQVDMIIATMTITSQRKNVVNFSNPYYVAGQALMTPKKSSIEGLTDLKDKRVIVVLGSTGEKSIKHFAPDAIIQGFKTNKEAYQALKSGLGEAMTTDDTILNGFAMDDPNMRILSKRYTQEPYAIAFRQDEESETLRANVNHILEHLQANGELNKLKKKWIKF